MRADEVNRARPAHFRPASAACGVAVMQCWVKDRSRSVRHFHPRFCEIFGARSRLIARGDRPRQVLRYEFRKPRGALRWVALSRIPQTADAMRLVQCVVWLTARNIPSARLSSKCTGQLNLFDSPLQKANPTCSLGRAGSRLPRRRMPRFLARMRRRLRPSCPFRLENPMFFFRTLYE
jgi:hypothetical protein